MLHLAKPHQEAQRKRGQARAFLGEYLRARKRARDRGAPAFRDNLGPCAACGKLVPDFKKTAPLDSPVTATDGVDSQPRSCAWKLPITPPPLANHGDYIVSLNKIVKWLGGLVEKEGVNLFTQFAGKELIYEGQGIAGNPDRRQGRGQEWQAQGELHARV